jgi:hypothetical protein
MGDVWSQGMYVEDSVTEALAVQLDFAALVACTNAVNDSPLGFNVTVALEMQPKEALACLAAATHEACTSEAGRARGLPQPGPGTLGTPPPKPCSPLHTVACCTSH